MRNGTRPSSGSPRIRLGTPRRWAVFALGIALLGSGVALSVNADLGVGSWQILETGLTASTGAPFGVVVVVESLAALVLAWVWLRQRPGPGTLVIALAVGPTVGWLLARLPGPGSLAAAGTQLVAGTLLLGLGVGLYAAAMLGPSAQDALFVGLYRRYPIRVGTARFALDATLVVAGWVLGGQVGAGTVVMTLALPLVVERTLRWGERLAGTRDPAIGHRPARP